MTKAATVVRHNDAARRGLRQGLRTGRAGQDAARSPTPATGRTRTSSSPRRCATCSRWPRRSCKGRSQRDECRGAHFKPEFAMPGLEATDPAERRREAEAVVRPLRGEHAQVAEDDDRHAVARRRTAVELRGRRHLADPAAAAAVRPGRRRRDRSKFGRNGRRQDAASRHAMATANVPGSRGRNATA